MKRLLYGAFVLLATFPSLALDLTVVSYNVDSDADTDPARVVQDAASMSRTG